MKKLVRFITFLTTTVPLAIKAWNWYKTSALKVKVDRYLTRRF